ncbi:hypothetical protein KDE12_01420 [Campylobacter sp. faydin G-105]|uniref:hypothetical protein n=1 Tax=Campylobacter anatolicus TaxID=2829105 RepID=UPI001B9660AE|nr:hypothetical protein [Campylobacter anatolicus]MBR8461512.1 hypothetical protein [Campylobacter anatolicus]
MQNITLQTLFKTEQVAKNYGISQDTVKDHLKNHSDEIIENTHFIVCKNDRNRPLIKWTLRGIIKLGMFIRSPQAKNFRLWAEMELEKSINAELEKAHSARKKNLELVNKISELEAFKDKQDKHHQSQINGYKSQICYNTS